MTTIVEERGARAPLPAGVGRDFRDEVPRRDVAALAAALDEVDLADASGSDLLARAVGWEQVVAMAQAKQAEVLGELAARHGVGTARVADELQAALSCTTYQARQMAVRAGDLAAHPALGDALADGTVDLRRVDAILDALPPGGDPQRWDGVVAVALDDAPSWSPPAVRRRVRQLVLAAEPVEAAARCDRARTERGVTLQALEDGMALLSAYLPAPAAVTAFTVVDALAGTRRDGEDDRTVHQRRADAFAGLFDAVAVTGSLPDGTALPRKQRRRPEIQVTVAATTLLGLDELPGELAGYGPIPAEMARAVARDGTWRRLLIDPVTGTLLDRGSTTYRPGADLAGFVMARDVTCTYMGCGQPAWRCELDHREPYDPSRPADEQTTAANLDARCKHHHEQKTSGGWTVRRIPGSGDCEWTDPWGVTFTRLAVPIVLTATLLERLREPHGSRGSRGSRGSHGSHGPPDDGPRQGYPDEPPF